MVSNSVNLYADGIQIFMIFVCLLNVLKLNRIKRILTNTYV